MEKVYLIKVEGKVVYVGRGCPKSRYIDHCYHAVYCPCTPFYKYLSNVIASGIIPTIHITLKGRDLTIPQRESHMIRLHHKAGTIYNLVGTGRKQCDFNIKSAKFTRKQKIKAMKIIREYIKNKKL